MECLLPGGGFVETKDKTFEPVSANAQFTSETSIQIIHNLISHRQLIALLLYVYFDDMSIYIFS